ncbi:MAG: TlpA family protein disulfide reductase [Candidatus Rokubacteria bacterium]|nr:TlpA family protein disulfide reductase [Candidatus Rokubacteria bacterium]
MRLLVAVAALSLAATSAVAAPAAPPLAFTPLGGEPRFDSRGALGKRVIVLRFQASWCKVCREEAAAVQHLHDKYSPRGVTVVAMHVEDTETETRRFMKARKVTYLVGLDPQLKTARRFGAPGPPYTLVIDRKGEIVTRVSGRTDEARLSRAIDRALAPPSRRH